MSRMHKRTEVLSYDQYYKLLAGYFSKHICIVGYDDINIVNWYSDGCLMQNNYPHPANILNNGTKKDHDHDLIWVELDDKINCYLIEVQDLHDEVIATLAVFFTAQNVNDEHAELARIAPSIIALRNIIQSEYQLNNELSGVTNELGERYDELNLIYATDDDIQNHAEADAALDRLIENCSEYLGVPLSALIVPQCNVNIHYPQEPSTIDDIDAVLEYISDQRIKQSGNSPEPVILNSLEDYASEGLDQVVSGKFISIPILTKGGAARGILACYKPEADVDYSNSDKNLLLTMARKVTKILNANFDTLTGLMSREAFECSTESALLLSKQTQNVSSILYINIDKTQIVNDVASLHAGDAVIKQVAAIIKSHLKEVKMIARIGGDIFGVLIENCGKEAAAKIANEIRLAISNEDFSWKQHKFDVTISIGVCELNEQTVSVTSAITAAEVSCDTAKEQGRNATVIDNDSNLQVLERKNDMHWVNRVQEALREQKFLLFAQPIQVLNGNPEAFHFEILLRMRDEDGSILSPGAFMHAAETYKVMPDLDAYVIKTAISTLEAYSPLIGGKHGSIAINLSGQSIRKNGFLDFILQQLSHSSVPANAFCFEVTETATLGCLNEAKHFIEQIKKIGCKFSLDDFGTGLSSFSYLKQLPVDYLKIDGSFVMNIVEDRVNDEMVRAIHRIGQVMNLKTIAEFVEDEAVMDHLRSIGINYGQGYHIGKPIPIEECLGMLTNNLGQHKANAPSD